MSSAASVPAIDYSANVRRYAVFTTLVSLQLFVPIWVIYLQEERGFSLAKVTAMEGPFWLSMVLLEVPTGAVADRFGRRSSIALGAFFYAIALAIFGMASTYVLIFASYLLWAGALTLLSGADAALFYDSLKAAGRESDFERLWGRIAAIRPAAGLASLLIGAPLAAMTALWVPIVASAGLMGAAFLVSLTFKEPPRFEEDGAQLGFLANSRQAASIAWRHRQVRAMLLLGGGIIAVGVTAHTLAQPYLRSHDVPVGLIGAVLLPAQLLAIVGALYAYRVSARIGTRAAILAAPVCMVSMAVATGAVDHLGIFVLFPLAALAQAIAMPVVAGYLNSRIPSAQRATILSFQQLLLSLGIAALLPLTGAFGDRSGMPAAYAVLALVGGALLAGCIALWLRADRSVAEPIAAAPASVDGVAPARAEP